MLALSVRNGVKPVEFSRCGTENACNTIPPIELVLGYYLSTTQSRMTKKEEKTLIEINKQLSAALKQNSSSTGCEHCKVRAAQLARITALYSEILESVIKREIRLEFAEEMIAVITKAVMGFTTS